MRMIQFERESGLGSVMSVDMRERRTELLFSAAGRCGGCMGKRRCSEKVLCDGVQPGYFAR